MNEQVLHDLACRFVRELGTSENLDGWRHDRVRRMDRAARLLHGEQIAALSEDDLRELFFDTNAFGFWRDKAAEWERRRERVGIDGLRATLQFLIERAEDGLSPEDLMEIRRNTGLGLLLSTELATYRFPDQCWIYSSKVTLPSLQALGCDLKAALPYGQKSDPYLYSALEEPVARLRTALAASGAKDVHNVLVDLFLWWVRGTLAISSPARRDARRRDPKPSPRETSLPTRVREIPAPYRPGAVDVGAILQESLLSAGLHYTSWQIAAFYTALQVKGFVILSGISGTGKTRLAQHFASMLNVGETRGMASRPGETNWLFVPVRPDWRDSKSLLGYYNPLTGLYEWTPFLRFLLRCARSHEAGDGLAYFVILDEMNLARVEYYFADLLSVLESGRDEWGWTREPLRFSFAQDAKGDLPPCELRLPPNLYFVGTVNTDETTHAFSPKVLDRAFALPLAEVSFLNRAVTEVSHRQAPGRDSRQNLLIDFTLGGRFPRAGVALVESTPTPSDLAQPLQILNELLRPYNLHFGYRVFDEIALFVERAMRNGLFGADGQDAAIDAAVLMKTLPKFHGSRSRLEGALRSVLAWCIDPHHPDHPAVQDTLRSIETSGVSAAALTVEKELGKLPYRYPATAAHARRMLQALYAEGFASFG